MKSPASLLLISLHITAQPQRAYFTAHQPHRLYRDDHYPAQAILLCHCFTQTIFGSAGISACCPSPTTSVLGLGPDLPWADEPSPGNLRLSTGMFLACLALLIPAFSLLCRPQLLSVLLLPAHNAPLPIVKDNSKASVTCFSPVTSSAHNYSTSELLRTLLMSGCF